MMYSQMELAYKTGDAAKAAKLAAILKPVEIGDIGKKPLRAPRLPASGT